MDDMVPQDNVYFGPIDYGLADNTAEVEDELKALYEKIKANPLVLYFNNAETSIADASGITALHYAVMFNHTSIVRQIMEAGADASIQDKKGYSALDYAKNSKNEELLTLLKQ